MPGQESVTLYRRGRLWWIWFYRDGKRVYQTTGTNNLKIAEETKRRIERELFDGTEGLEHTIVRALRDPRRREGILAALAVPPEKDVQAALEEYLNYATTYKMPQTIYSDRLRLAAFFSNAGVKSLAEVTTRQVETFFAMKKNGDGVTDTTVLRYREALHAMFVWAVDVGYCLTNPVSKTHRPKLPDLDPRFLTIKQIETCLKVVEGDPIEAIVETAIYAGPRREELCWMTVDDIDLDGRLIHVRRKIVDGVEWMPKTKRNRKIPISTSLYPHLTRQRLRCGDGPWFFPSPEGCRWDPDNLGHRLHFLMQGAGLPWTFLDFRHTFGSHLIQKGVSAEKIAKFMGNSAAVVRRHYARLIPEELHADVEFGACVPTRQNLDMSGSK